MKKIGELIENYSKDNNFEENDIIDSLLENPDIRAFVLKHDLTNDSVKRGIILLIEYINDKHFNPEEGVEESKKFPGYKPVLSLNGGDIQLSYQKIVNPNVFVSKMSSLSEPTEVMKAQLSDFSLADKERLSVYQYARTFANSFLDKPIKGMYISGAFRTGKSYLAAAIGNDVASHNKSVFMVYYPELSMRLKKSIGTDDEEFLSIVDEMKGVDLLILDDFGGEAFNSYIRDEVLGVVLQYRLTKNKPIIITSNIFRKSLIDTSLRRDGSEAETIKALRISERIKEMTEEFHLLNRYKI